MIILVSHRPDLPAQRADRLVLPAHGVGLRAGDPGLAAGRADGHPALALILLAKAPIERRESPLVRWLQRGYTALLARIVPRPDRRLRDRGARHGGRSAGCAAAWAEPVPGVQGARLPDALGGAARRLPGGECPHRQPGQQGAAGDPGVRNFGAHIGQGTLSDEVVGMNFTENWISIDPDVDYDKTLAAVQKVVDGYPGLQRDVQTYLKERTKEVLTGSSDAIVVRIFGDDLDVLREKADEVKELVAGIDGIIDEHVTLQTNIPQLHVEVDLAKASQYGIKPGDVRRTAATFIASEEAGDIWRNGKNTEVHVWSVPEARNSIESVRQLLMDAPDGRKVPLGELAEVKMVPTPNQILRENGSRRHRRWCQRGREGWP